MASSKPPPGQPPRAHARMLEAVAHHQAGRLREAEAIYLQILDEQPRNPDALHLAGVIATQTRRDQRALDLIRRAIEINPQAPAYHVNLGIVLFNRRELQQSADTYRHAISLDKNLPEAWSNLAQTLLDLLKPEESVAAADEALRLRNDFADAHWNRSMALLTLGQWQQGWAEYEWRLRRPDKIRKELFAVSTPRWDGSAIPGKTLLLLAEQGFGDNIQFARYIAAAARRCGRVIVECPPPLTRLTAKVAGVAEAFSAAPPGKPLNLPPHDFQAPLASLPHLLSVNSNKEIASIPYIQADPELLPIWHHRLAHAAIPPKNRRIGLVWAGNDLPNPRRTVGLAALAPLASLPGTTFVSLQKGPHAAECSTPPLGLPIVDRTDCIEDFADTAALISGLDTVITIDSAVAHLAGAMGKPTLTLLPHACDWRWAGTEQQSAWYPTMRLFRQDKPGDWSPVVERVRDALF